MNPTEFRQLLGKQQLTLAYFSTDDCTVCKSLKPKIIKLLDEHRDWTMTYVDCLTDPELAWDFMVLAVPVILLFVEGREAGRFNRYVSMDDLEQALIRLEALVEA